MSPESGATGTAATPRILVVDDEAPIREMLVEFLGMRGYKVTFAENGRDALNILQRQRVDLILTDMKMPELGGIELLGEVSQLRSPPTTILMTGYGTVDTAISAMKQGAYDYIIKPFKLKEVAATITRALERARLERENLKLRGTTSLYHLSEAVSSGDNLDNLFEIYTEVCLDELQADLILLLLESQEDPGTYTLASFYSRNPLSEEGVQDVVANIELAQVMVPFVNDEPLLAHREEVKKYLTLELDPPAHSLLGIPLRLGQGHVVGFTIALSTDPMYRFEEGHRKMAAVLAGKVTYAVEKTKLYGQIGDHRRQTLAGLANILMAKDAYIRHHSESVARLTRMICEQLELDATTIEWIVYGALMHDVGKIGIRLDKLNATGKLSAEDYDLMKQHPELARFILEPLDVLEDVKPVVYHHHERWDGRGYPAGLKAEEIPFGARIVSVADAYDAITSKRVYVKDTSHETAISELKRNAGTQFDAKIVEAFLAGIDEYRDKQGDYHANVEDHGIPVPHLASAYLDDEE